MIELPLRTRQIFERHRRVIAASYFWVRSKYHTRAVVTPSLVTLVWQMETKAALSLIGVIPFTVAGQTLVSAGRGCP
jgi:hypothetical protein